MSKVFIAWARSRSRSIAELLSTVLPDIIGCTTWICDKDVDAGDIWIEGIRTGLRESDAVVVCLTRQNYDSPWLPFEAAGVWKARDKKEGGKIICLLIGMDISELDGRDPLTSFEAVLADENGFLKMLKSLNASLPESERRNQETLKEKVQFYWPEFDKRLAEILAEPEFPSELLDRNHVRCQRMLGSGSIYLTLVADQIVDSPFQFMHLARGAKKQLFISGQNLHSLTCGKDASNYKSFLFQRLDEGLKIQMLVCDKEDPYSPEAWARLFPDEGKYVEDLKNSTDVLRDWAKSVPDKKKLEIKRTPLVPYSITFQDPNEDFGRMVLTTVINQEMPDWRPCFLVLREQHRHIFWYYWTLYQKLFKEGKAI